MPAAGRIALPNRAASAACWASAAKTSCSITPLLSDRWWPTARWSLAPTPRTADATSAWNGSALSTAHADGSSRVPTGWTRECFARMRRAARPRAAPTGARSSVVTRRHRSSTPTLAAATQQERSDSAAAAAPAVKVCACCSARSSGSAPGARSSWAARSSGEADEVARCFCSRTVNAEPPATVTEPLSAASCSSAVRGGAGIGRRPRASLSASIQRRISSTEPAERG
mmetsp:Transcript_3437/g.10277  ORF Transcript_3437/g.10277 Transcript_3437/m.10277 type:complete len:228 (-) Transcript_3437:354-1037(-)